MNKADFFVLFPSPMVVYEVNQDLSCLESLKILDYNTFFDYGSYNEYISKDDKVLDKINSDVKELMLNYFNTFKKDILDLHNTEFEITNSWSKFYEPLGFGSWSRASSAFNGLLCLEDGDEPVRILFDNPIYPGWEPENETGQYMNRYYCVEFKKNTLLLYPSYIHNRILSNMSNDITRFVFFNIIRKT